MRMWNLPPKIMCRKHLLGEHLELHMMIGAIKKGKNISGYLRGLYDPSQIPKRHEELVEEMKRRRYNHKSPIIVDISSLPKGEVFNPVFNLKELTKRCKECSNRLHLIIQEKGE